MSEIGVIGQMYEDRRTKKKGKLVERDEKYKTLLFESEDGKSFNISFGGFKSNWRSCDEPVETIEEALQEVEVPKQKPKKKEPVKVVKSGSTDMGDYEKVFTSYIKSLNSDKVSLKFVPAKAKKSPYVMLKIGRNKFIDLHLRARGNFWIMMPEFVYTQAKWATKLINVVNTPKNRREISCSFSCDELETFLEDIRPVIVDVLSAKVEEDK